MITRLREGRMGAENLIERQTTKVPTDTFLWAAAGSILLSLLLKSRRRDEDALFVGQWAPTFVLLSLVAKLAKKLGED